LGFKFPRSSDTVVEETTFGQSANAGTKRSYSRGDHTHGTPALPQFGFIIGSKKALTVNYAQLMYASPYGEYSLNSADILLLRLPLFACILKAFKVYVISNSLNDYCYVQLVRTPPASMLYNVNIPAGATGYFTLTADRNIADNMGIYVQVDATFPIIGTIQATWCLYGVKQV